MSKQLIFVIGAPSSGRSTWINKNLFNPGDSVLVDANNYPGLYVRSEKKNASILYEDTIDDSRKWCLEQVKTQMELETPVQKIILSLIACRPDRWREFIELAVTNSYDIVFKFPSNKLLFYSTKHNSSMEQFKFIDGKNSTRYPKDKKEITRKNSKDELETVMVDTNESSLFRYIVTECESAYSFYLQNRVGFGVDKEQLLTKINLHYKTVITGDAKRVEKKAKDAEREAEKKAKDAEREAKKLAKQEEKIKQRDQVEQYEVEQYEVEQEIQA
jgi:hypothetical protein